MSRIRSIKPEFWTSEQVLECSTNARLLFLGLLNFCDDFGRHPHSAKQCKAEVFPADDFTEKDILGMLHELSGNGLITVYATGGKEYFYVTGWKHQRIDKPQPAKYPDPFAEDSTNVPRVIPPDRKGEDTKGEEGKGVIRTVAKATRPGDDLFETFKKLYPKRKGGNPWKSAKAAFEKLIRDGTEAEDIFAALREGVGFDRDKIGTEFIPQAVKWLKDERFRDRAAPAQEIAPRGFYVVDPSPQMDAWLFHERERGQSYPRDRNGGWHFPTEWPPGYGSEAP